MVSVLKFSSCITLISFVVCVSAYNRNQGFRSIYPKFPVQPLTSQFPTNQVAFPVQSHVQLPVHGGKFYNQYAPHPTQLPVAHAGFPPVYPAPAAYPVPVFGNPFGNIHRDPHAKVVAKSVIYSLLFSTLLNRVG